MATDYKTLKDKIKNSPYFIKHEGIEFSQILFKPGYPLQSAELITLQNIINEQIQRFGRHVFKEGSIVQLDEGIDGKHKCLLYELNEDLTKFEIKDGERIQFKRRSDGAVLKETVGIEIKRAFSEKDERGVTLFYKDMLAVHTDGAFTDPSEPVDVYVGQNTGSHIGSLYSNTPKNGRFASIGYGIFFIGGYFTNIQKQKFIYWVDSTREMNCEVGIELIWEIADISHPQYGQWLFDPAENAFNENSPGADRLILKLGLTKKPLGYTQLENDWKFVPLLKYEENQPIYHVRYPIYNELGEQLADRIYDINGNFVVDEFSLTVTDDSLIKGEHKIILRKVENSDPFNTDPIENHWKINGRGTSYKQDLEKGQYLIFGDSVHYNRLLKIVDIEDDYTMILSDIHYDAYEDTLQNRKTLDQLWFDERDPETNTLEVKLRDERKFNYQIGAGKAYVKGWRYIKEFETKEKDNKARKTKIVPETVSPNRHYFVMNYDEYGPFICNQYVNTERFIEFSKLEQVDLHCTENKEYYELDFSDAPGHWTAWTSANLVEDGLYSLNNAQFRCVESLNNLFEIIKYTKNESDGLPVSSRAYSVEKILPPTNATSTNVYELDRIEKVLETPYSIDAPSNYMAETVPLNEANTTFDVGNNIVEFNCFPSGGNFYDRNFANNDFILISNNEISIFGQVSNTVNPSQHLLEVRTFPGLLSSSEEYQLTKPSEFDFHNLQYNSTKIGTIRANSISSNHPERFYFSHFKLNEDFAKGLVYSTDYDSVTNEHTVTVLDLRFSFASDVYNDMLLTHNNKEWPILDYNGKTQTFTLGNVTPSNPINFSHGDEVGIRAKFKDVSSIVKIGYPNGKSFKANIRRDAVNYPMVRTPNGTQQKFRLLLEEGKGEVKSVKVYNNSYNIFAQHLLISGALQKTFTINFTTSNIADNDLGNQTQVYAAENIPVPGSLNDIQHLKGSKIGFQTSKIQSGTLQLVLDEPIPANSKIIVHLEVTVKDPQLRTKKLYEAVEDKFDVAIENGGLSYTTPNRVHSLDSIELKHSDIYRIRKIEIAVGKRLIDNPSDGQFVNFTHYFNLDNGQRETHYDHGRLQLKGNLKLPVIPLGSYDNYVFKVTYDYFNPNEGHYFAVNSYTDIHYRSIPTYTNPTNKKYPLRNVIDFRPVRKPAGETFDYDQEVDFTSESIDLDFEYYLSEEKVISIEGNDSSSMKVQYENKEDYKAAGWSLHLYNVKIPAYTFNFEDIEYQMIDNRRFTMNDISRLQKRIENLEDIAQLNSLELQTIQTKLVNSDGDPRYKNGMVVDMFAGFNIADVDEVGFSASIDLHHMKMYPKFNSENYPLRIVSTVASAGYSFPTVRQNIVFLPITSNKKIGSDTQTLPTTTTATNSVSANFANQRDGILTLHPFSESWYSKNITAQPAKNEDNQYKNWKILQADAHGTQWAEWDTYIFGNEVENSEISSVNATLSQKTGVMVNNKNSIEKIIDNKKVNTTLNYFSKNIRVGYVWQSISSTGNSPHNLTHKYHIDLGDSGQIPSQHEGMRLTYEQTGTSLDQLRKNYTGYEISQDISTLPVNTAKGIIQHITPGSAANQYELYVTNIESYKFIANKKLKELVGDIVGVHDFSNGQMDTANHIICGDFEIPEKRYPLNSIINVRIVNSDNDTVEGSSKFYMGSLIETMTSHCQSVRPVQQKLYSDELDTKQPYIDDRTYKISGSIQIPTKLHQPFAVDKSMFISQISLGVSNQSANPARFSIAIQPIVNGHLSPSLVLPFSEQRVEVRPTRRSIMTIPFEVPVFISSNKDYALVIFTNNTSDDLKFFTESTWTNSDVLYSDCYSTSTSGAPVQLAGRKLSVCFYHAVFDTQKTYEINLQMKDSVSSFHADLSRLNITSLDLADTNISCQWRARNYDSLVIDAVPSPILKNQTIKHDKRKIFNKNDYRAIIHMNSSNVLFTPMIDLERSSILGIQHQVNDGGLKRELISGYGTRTGSFTDDLRIVMREKAHTELNDYALTPGREASFQFDKDGSVSNVVSSSNFLTFNDKLDFEIQKWDSGNTMFVIDSTATNTYNSTTDTYTISGDNYVIQSLRIINEFDHKNAGNPDYRYYSPIVTLADDFEAMQLYVQMDTILKRSGEVFVYYRTLESSAPLEDLRDKRFSRMEFKTHAADKYSNNNRSKTLEFETKREGQRFKYFQVKVCFTSLNFVEVPIVENIRILALDN